MASNWSCESTPPCPVMASAVLVREMVNNLIDNAIHYAGAGATATVSVSNDADNAVLAVDDDGTGVGEEDLPVLFERFRRGRDAPQGGSGLGLSIVAEIAQIFGGTAKLATPSGGRGFRVEVSLPLAEPGDRDPRATGSALKG